MEAEQKCPQTLNMDPQPPSKRPMSLYLNKISKLWLSRSGIHPAAATLVWSVPAWAAQIMKALLHFTKTESREPIISALVSLMDNILLVSVNGVCVRVCVCVCAQQPSAKTSAATSPSVCKCCLPAELWLSVTTRPAQCQALIATYILLHTSQSFINRCGCRID